VLWLHAPLFELKGRIEASSRPLRKTNLSELFSRRCRSYAQADALIDAQDSVEHVVSRITHALERLNTARRIRVQAPSKAYDVYVGHDGFAHATAWLIQNAPPHITMVVDDKLPEALYVRMERLLRAAHLDVSVMMIDVSEANKGLQLVERLWDHILAKGSDRNSLVVAVGGGVTGDVAGFAASTAMRGIQVVHVATTLLSMVDSSVGGKTAINRSQGKNLVGTFHQPSLVCCAMEALDSLPVAEMRSGWAEVIKVAATHDAAFFQSLEALPRLEPTEADIAAAVDIKATVVAQDERESGYRKVLNFGHTVGHVIEHCAPKGALRHGEAVALGMVAALQLSVDQGVCPVQDARRIVEVLRRVPLPVVLPDSVPFEQLREALVHDKKLQRRGDESGIHFVRCLGLGRADLRWQALETIPLQGGSVLGPQGEG
ncbi:MAG TPA: 3-dehydroquinate synthase, partial [Myxococcales bacterium]|nr:3-dehydroquinate synthase [Myxococcales bacterium]